MKKVLVILLLVFLVSGCDDVTKLLEKVPRPGSSGEETEDKKLGPSGYVKMDILYPLEKEAIIKSYEFNEFSPTIRLTNTGFADSRGQVCITGLESDAFAGSSGCDCLTYAFVKEFDEKTYEPETLIFGPYTLDVQEEHSGDFALTAINRYEYKSEALFKPCIRKDPYDREDCTVKTNEIANGPIAISSITEKIAPTKGGNVRLAFKVELKKTADGKAIPQTHIDMECAVDDFDSLETRKTKAKVYGVMDNLPYIGSVSCTETSLEEGKGTMDCVVGEVQMFDENGNYLFGSELQTASKLTLSYAFEAIDSNKFSVGG